jgi:hypothetical protein
MRRLTPSPTELAENQNYLIGLRPRELRDRILENLRLNDLPLVVQTPAGEVLDCQILQRIISENAQARNELVRLSLASYTSNSQREAETLLNFVFSRLTSSEMLAIQNLLKENIIDDSVIGNLINLIRLTGINDPLKFISLVENSFQGTLSLRQFLGTLENSTQTSLGTIQNLKVQEVNPEILDAINQKESQALIELDERAAAIESNRLSQIEQIVSRADTQRILFNTGVTFGISGLVWASYRFGFWETIISGVSSQRPRPFSENETSFFENLKYLFAGTSGFLLKKMMLRR